MLSRYRRLDFKSYSRCLRPQAAFTNPTAIAYNRAVRRRPLAADCNSLSARALLPPSANSMLSNLDNRIRLRKAPTAVPEG